ncbi:MAG TPA: hypothetical protein VMZ25_06145 [Terriglobales bacterium]|nr:hypothetical protein [Terriglobales bacterium]
MAKIKERTYEDTLAQLRERGFDILEAPATPNRVFVKKLGCSAAIEKNADNDGVRLFAKPGYLVAGEISRLTDKGFQKVLTTSKTEVPATADHLKAIHAFSEELREAMGATSLYNEALGTVSDRYVYDRVKDRDQPEPARKKRPWEALKGTTKKGA